jgi:hypothetical protein
MMLHPPTRPKIPPNKTAEKIIRAMNAGWESPGLYLIRFNGNRLRKIGAINVPRRMPAIAGVMSLSRLMKRKPPNIIVYLRTQGRAEAAFLSS